MGCICVKQRRKYEEAVVLASQTRCKLFLFLFLYSFSGRNLLPFFLVKCICTPYIIAVNVTEIETLYKLFMKLSSSIVSDGVISKEEFQLGLFRNCMKQNLFADRMFQLLDSKHDGVIEFEEFVRSLSIFHPDASQEEKVAFAFQIYDIWKSGFIEREEVKEMLLEFLKDSDMFLSDEIIEYIIEKTFEEADLKRDGKIDMEEWKEFVSRNPSILNNMTIPYLK